MGVGRDAAGAWHPYEDFRWAAEFAAFLDAADREGAERHRSRAERRHLRSVQSSAARIVRPAPTSAAPKAKRVARLDRVLTAHDAEIAALEAFARKGIEPRGLRARRQRCGAALPGRRPRLLSAMAAPPAAWMSRPPGYWLSSDGRVHAEHGHQIGFSPHRFETGPLHSSRATAAPISRGRSASGSPATTSSASS